MPCWGCSPLPLLRHLQWSQRGPQCRLSKHWNRRKGSNKSSVFSLGPLLTSTYYDAIIELIPCSWIDCNIHRCSSSPSTPLIHPHQAQPERSPGLLYEVYEVNPTKCEVFCSGLKYHISLLVLFMYFDLTSSPVCGKVMVFSSPSRKSSSKTKRPTNSIL